ncbi:hypothetical protein [Streptomyces sp. YIM S03343]
MAGRKARLDALAAQHADEGIEAAAFPADLSDPAWLPPLVDAIRGSFGRIDGVEYTPIGGDTSPGAGGVTAVPTEAECAR